MRILKFALMLPVILIEIVATILETVAVIARSCLSIVRVWLFREYDYRQWLKRDLADCESILEMGCGDHSPILYIGYGQKTDAVDIWQPYIDKHNRAGDYRKCWQADIIEMTLPLKSYDAVVVFDVLEHLPRKAVEESDLFADMENCARKKVIIFAPNGFIENDEADDDPWQKHISAWEPVDYLKRDYKVIGATGLRYLFGKGSLPRYRPHKLCAILGMLSQLLVFHKPELAFHSYAVKEKKDNK